MATKKRKRSALKRIRQTERRTTVKTIGRSAARTAVRTAREAIAKGGEAWRDPQEQRTPPTRPDREGRGEDQQEEELAPAPAKGDEAPLNRRASG